MIPDNKNKTNNSLVSKNIIAYIMIFFSFSAILVISVAVVNQNPENAINVFNIIVPLFASWIGTILAFYFGRQHIESANQNMKEVLQKITPEKRIKHLISTILRNLNNMTYYQLSPDQQEKDIALSSIKSKFNERITRLPIINSDGSPKYMIHESSLMNYCVLENCSVADNLEQFINYQNQKNIQYGNNNGFVTVSEYTTLGEAKFKMEQCVFCQDIFVTLNGNSNETLIGWVSNLRLAKFIEIV